MQRSFKSFLIIFFITILSNNSFSHESVAYINLDYILNNSLLGKKIINKLNLTKENNFKDIKTIETKLKKREEKLIKEKNIVSDEVFNNNLKDLKKEISQFRIKNAEINKKFQNIKKVEFDKFLNQIEPILSNYMQENSLNILLDKKNIFIGKSELDITEKIINILNEKFK